MLIDLTAPGWLESPTACHETNCTAPRTQGESSQRGDVRRKRHSECPARGEAGSIRSSGKGADFRRRLVHLAYNFFSTMPFQSSRYRGGSDALTRAFRTLPQLPRARELANGAFKRSESATCRVFLRPARLMSAEALLFSPSAQSRPEDSTGRRQDDEAVDCQD